MDLTQYGPSPYAEGGKARNTQRNPLSAALRGFLQQEESGSVLQPDQAELSNWNSAGQAASHIADIATALPMKGVAAMGAVVPLLVGNKTQRLSNETLKSMVLASELASRGKSPREIYQATSLMANPALPSGANPETTAKWLKNVSIMTPGQTVPELLRRFERGGPLEYIIPDSPLIKEFGDKMGDIRAGTFGLNKPAPDTQGVWYPKTREMLYDPTHGPVTSVNLINHELSHGGMDTYRQHYNAGSQLGWADPLTAVQKQFGRDIRDQLANAAKTSHGRYLVSHIDRMLSGDDLYGKSSGEWIARRGGEFGVADAYKTPAPAFGHGAMLTSDGIMHALYKALRAKDVPTAYDFDLDVVDALNEQFLKELRKSKLPVTVNSVYGM